MLEDRDMIYVSRIQKNFGCFIKQIENSLCYDRNTNKAI